MNDLNPQEIIDIITLDRITEVLRLRNTADPDDARTEVIGDLHRIRNMLMHNADVTYLDGEAARAAITRTLCLLAELGDLEKTSLGTANARRIRSHATAGRVAEILSRHAEGGNLAPYRLQMEYVCKVCDERIQPDARGMIRVEGVTHSNAPKAWVWGPVPCHDECRTRLQTPYDDLIEPGEYCLTWQEMTA